MTDITDKIAALPLTHGWLRLEAERDLALELLQRLLEVHAACNDDHHGYCQAHYIESPCRVADARAFLAACGKEGKHELATY